MHAQSGRPTPTQEHKERDERCLPNGQHPTARIKRGRPSSKAELHEAEHHS